MKALHLLGPTGAGKSPLGDFLERYGLGSLRFHHFDFGAELRRIALNGASEVTPQERDFIRKVLSEGRLLEREHLYLAHKILNHFWKRRGANLGDHLVLNGLPRHKEQLEAVQEEVEIRLVVELVLDRQTLLYRLKQDPAGDRKGRLDDTPDLIARKLRWYEERTRPLIEEYQKQGIPVVRIAVEKEDTGAELYQKLLFSLSREEFKFILTF